MIINQNKLTVRCIEYSTMNKKFGQSVRYQCHLFQVICVFCFNLTFFFFFLTAGHGCLIVCYFDMHFFERAQSGIEAQDIEFTAVWPSRGKAPFVLQVSYRALYNVSGIHSIPAILNIMSYSVLKAINASAPTIVTFNKRWPATSKYKRLSVWKLVWNF